MVANLLVVAFGSAAGGVLRYLISFFSKTDLTPFPYWTFIVNVLGSFLIGLLAGLIPTDSEKIRLLLITGFCGGFTTFSAFSLETLELFQQGSFLWSLINIGLHIGLTIGGCWAGYIVAR